jgi:hypothetical protein
LIYKGGKTMPFEFILLLIVLLIVGSFVAEKYLEEEVITYIRVLRWVLVIIILGVFVDILAGG